MIKRFSLNPELAAMNKIQRIIEGLLPNAFCLAHSRARMKLSSSAANLEWKDGNSAIVLIDCINRVAIEPMVGVRLD